MLTEVQIEVYILLVVVVSLVVVVLRYAYHCPTPNCLSIYCAGVSFDIQSFHLFRKHKRKKEGNDALQK